MRRAVGTLLVLAALSGCKNQSAAPLTNPFLTPDRVPPPATRIPAPGAAQPYYAGDPAAAGTAFGAAPPPTFAPGAPLVNGAIPPATAYPPTPGYAPTLSPPHTGYPGATPLPGTVPSYPTTPAYGTGGAPVSPPGGWGPYPPSSQTQPLMPATLQAREVTTAEFTTNGGFTGQISPVSTASGVPATFDGFRPQGTLVATTTGDVASADRGFRPPGIRSTVDGDMAESPSTERFAAGQQFDWLRGQIEYWSETGQWTLRYLAPGQLDTYGGRVTIENPQVLGNLAPGEFVMVRGQLFGRANDGGQVVPAYRIAAVQRQKM